MVEIDDKCLTQSTAIMDYIGAKFKLQPLDLLLKHKGEKICAFWLGDIVSQIMKLHDLKEEDKAACTENLMKNVLPAAFLKLEMLLENTKYICGDKLC